METIINEIMEIFEISSLPYMYIILGVVAIISICCCIKK